jgi:hypothetical protein
MKAKSIKGRTPEEIRAALHECLANGYRPTLAIVFLSIKQDMIAVCKLLDKEGIEIFGCSTAGEFIDGDIGQGSIAIMLLDINPSFFKVVFYETADSTTFEISRQIGLYGKNLFTNPAFIIGSGGLLTDGENIVIGIVDAVGPDVTLFGGLAGDDMKMDETFVFSNGKSSSDGLVAIIVNEEKISLHGLAICGWKPVGTIRTVTKSEGAVVYTIDEEPALDLVLRYLGVKFDLDSRKDVVLNIGAYFPLQLQRDNAPPVLRTVMFVNKKDRSLYFAGNVPQGSKLRFSLPPDFEMIDEVVEECNNIKKTQSETDAIIMFSCISRYMSFGEMTSQEIEKVQQVLDCPLIGFFTYGEIGTSKNGSQELYNNTCCVVALKEK